MTHLPVRTLGIRAVVLSLFALPSPSLAADSWNAIQSPNFHIVGEVSYGQLKSVAQTLERFRLATTRVFPEREVASKRPLTFLVVNRDTMLTFVPSSNIAGFYTNALGTQDVIVMRSDLGREAIRAALHEYQHLINRATWGPLPRWVNEGLAEFYSTFYETDGGKRYQIGLPIPDHLRWLKVAGEDQLVRFLVDDGRSMSLDETRRAGIFYAQSWALVHFFTFGDGGKWNGSFPAFVEALVKGTEPVEALRRTVTDDVKGFESRFRIYLDNSQFSYAWFAVPSGAGEIAIQQSKLPAADTETLKASLMFDAAKALRILDQALAADPTYKPAQLLKARRLFDTRDPAAADALSAAARDNRNDVEVCGRAMFALNVSRRFEEALALCPSIAPPVDIAFERSIALEGLGRSAETGPLRARLLTASDQELQPMRWRAWRYLEEGAYLPARRASELVASRGAGSPDAVTYLRIVATTARCLAGECPDARAQLTQTRLPDAAGEWVQNVVRFLKEEIDADELVKRAQRKEEQTEAHAYVAFDQLARGRQADAMRHLKWVVDEGTDAVTERAVAVAHYRRLMAAAAPAR